MIKTLHLKVAFLFHLIVFMLTVQSCVEHDLPVQTVEIDCTGFKTVSFINDIKPIITSNCAIPDCHNGDNGANIDWRVFSNFKGHATQVKRRVSLPQSDQDHMPRKGELDESQIQLIVCWVGQGSLDN